MKTLAHASIALAIITFVLALVERFGSGAILGIGRGGYLQVSVIALLFGINFALLQLLNKQ